jgi:hypothetical protein
MGFEDPANRTQQAVERTAPVGMALLGFPTNGERPVNGYPARSYSSGDR